MGRLGHENQGEVLKEGRVGGKSQTRATSRLAPGGNRGDKADSEVQVSHLCQGRCRMKALANRASGGGWGQSECQADAGS